jgi:multidrug efflux pump subunit AcrB
MSIAKFSVKNPVLVNVIMIGVIVLGSYSLVTLPRELMPDVSFPWIFVFVPAPGLSPEEVEDLIVIPLERALANVKDLESMTSISRENGGFVWLKFETMPEDEFDKRLQDVRSKVDGVSLPEAAKDPDISQFATQDFAPMVNLVVSGDLPERELKEIAEDLRDDILDIKNISRVQITGVRAREIWVEVDPSRLEAYNLALAQVIQAIAQKHLDLTAGDIAIGRFEYTVRTIGKLQGVEELEDVIIRSSPNGSLVRLRDVAAVIDTFEVAETISRFNGEPSATLTISKKKEGNSIRLIDQIRALAEKYKAERLPEGASITITQDTSVWIKDILGKLQNNAWMGMILVIVMLGVFIGWRNALYAAVGIPVTFMFTFLFMNLTGHSINGNSLFAMVLVLGMIVDDAIVIIENAYRYLQRGLSPRQAAVVGTQEVMWPVIASSATTVAAFLPLMLLPGIIGDFMEIVPIIVSLALAASLIEALGILPAHIAEWSRPVSRGTHTGLIHFRRARRWYVRTLAKLLRRRHAVLGITTLVVLGSIPLIFVVGVDMFAEEEFPQFRVFVNMPEGTRMEITDSVVRRIEQAALALPKDEVKHVVSNTGIQQTEGEWFFKPSVGQLFVDLYKRNERERSIEEIMDDLRQRIRDIPGVKSLQVFRTQTGPPIGPPVEVKVKGPYLRELREVADLVKEELRQIPGVVDVRDDFVPGKRELKIRLNEDKAALYGLTMAQVAIEVRNAFSGGVAAKYREGDDEIDIVVKYNEEARKNLESMLNLRLLSPLTGELVPFKDVAYLTEEPGFGSIKHDDRERTITVAADIKETETSAQKVSQELFRRFSDISKRYPDYTLEFGGQFEEFKNAFKDIGRLFLVGLILMYIILAGQFKSFLQPIIIFMAIVFAFWGALMGLIAIRSPFSINNLFGLVALAGVAVNDSLVLISFINDRRERGMSRWRSILEAGKLRMRPILLTTVTTVFGLLPMAIGLGGKSETWGPLANVIVWGLSVGTVLTLFIIPCLYAGFGDLIRFWYRLRMRMLQALHRRGLITEPKPYIARRPVPIEQELAEVERILSRNGRPERKEQPATDSAGR